MYKYIDLEYSKLQSIDVLISEGSEKFGFSGVSSFSLDLLVVVGI